MASEIGPEAAGWGISYGLFGSDSSADPDGSEPPARSRSTRQKSSRSASSSFGRTTSAKGRGAPQARRRSGSPGRASFDDPFAPVVGASADAAEAPDAPTTGDGTGRRRARDGGGRSSPRGARRGRRDAAAGPSDDVPEGDGTAGEDTPVRSDEEWTSLARSVLLRQLAMGARSRHQLDRKLAEREVPRPIAAALLDRFEEVQLIDDAEFARMWVRTRTAARSLSRSSLRRELADKGIDASLAEDALLQLSDEEEDEQAREVVRRKLRRSADLSDRAVRDKEMRRLVGVLARKGYSPGTAFSIVKDVLAEGE
ncbi:regulatory protein RecX [Arthrobacter sp. SX1312]|uniref:regulatory protein RecX n=1 Tax=Arthrobacter sp. SX1312 TaxID=2058896 RepID=UPI0021576819|nr:regulatory protein RecX [Arthrobacter sp. SX1312]